MNAVTPLSADSRQARWRRRAKSIPAVYGALLAVLVTAPLVIPATVVFDLARGKWRFPTLRLGLFLLAYLAIDAWCIAVGVVLWFRYGFGTRLSTAGAMADHSRMQWWWAERLSGAARRTMGLRFEIDSPEPISPGPVIALGRHASYGDAILPVLLFGAWAGMELRYVLTIGLAWDPSLDIFGHRLRNHFVDRNPAQSSKELLAVAHLARGLGRDDVAVIFPEGQFFTEARKARAVARIEADDPTLAARAAALRHLLPPRPGGVLALLGAAPGADVVFIGHVGFEGFSRVADIWRNVPLRQPVRVRTWRVAAADIPSGRRERVDWLYNAWATLDTWVDNELKAPGR